LNGDRIEDLRFEGKGCAISTASASLMTEAVKGKTRAAVRCDLFIKRAHDLLTRAEDAPAAEDLGKLAALSGVREFPARVKCASLCWHTLNAALRSAPASQRSRPCAHTKISPSSSIAKCAP
jgi:nitrogen fixation NifU-like protein